MTTLHIIHYVKVKFNRDIHGKCILRWHSLILKLYVFETYCNSNKATFPGHTLNHAVCLLLTFTLLQHLVIAINLTERKAKLTYFKWNIWLHRDPNNSYVALLTYSSQFILVAVCHIVTFLSCSALDIWKSNFLQCCV